MNSDLVNYTSRFLNIQDIARLSRVSKLYHSGCNKNDLWKYLVKRDFGKTEECITLNLKERTYKQYYKDLLWERLVVSYEMIEEEEPPRMLLECGADFTIRSTICTHIPIRKAYEMLAEASKKKRGQLSIYDLRIELQKAGQTPATTRSAMGLEGYSNLCTQRKQEGRLKSQRTFSEATHWMKSSSIRSYFEIFPK